jgi:hypothetical protein
MITNGKNMTRKFRAFTFAETAAFCGRFKRFLLFMPISAGLDVRKVRQPGESPGMRRSCFTTARHSDLMLARIE